MWLLLNTCILHADPPNVSVSPALIIVNRSSLPSVSFSCVVTGIPLPLVTWIQGRTNTNLTNDITTEIQQTTTGNTVVSVLTIPSPREPDESNYTCSGANNVTNLLNTPEQATAELYVQGNLLMIVWKPVLIVDFTDPATIETNPQDVTSPAGTNVVRLFCRVQGIPIPSISWFKNGQLLTSTSHIFIILSDVFYIPNSEEPEFAIRSSTLLIQNLELGDDANYTCRAENMGSLGTVFTVESNQAHLSVECK